MTRITIRLTFAKMLPIHQHKSHRYANNRRFVQNYRSTCHRDRLELLAMLRDPVTLFNQLLKPKQLTNRSDIFSVVDRIR